MAKYSIKDLEKLSGIKAHTIRIWEKRYELINPSRTSTNIRYYSDQDLKKLLNVSTLHRNGIKISKIAQMSDQEIVDKVRGYAAETSDYESQVENLVISMIELDEDRFERILSKSIIRIGFDETIVRLVYPLFEKVGVLWLTGTINPAQEHFMSNLIRQKLISAIDSQIFIEKPDEKKFMLFLNETEMHELGLLFYSYLLKKQGHRVIYLGQSVPFNDLREINKIQFTEYMLTSFTAAMPHKEMPEYIQKLSSSFPDRIIFITGLQMKDIEQKDLPNNIIKVGSPQELLKILEDLDVKKKESDLVTG